MTPDRTDSTPDENADSVDNAVLADAGNLDTTSIGILGTAFTAQVPVTLPGAADEDVDDGVVDDGIPYENLPFADSSEPDAVDEVVTEAEVEASAEAPEGQNSEPDDQSAPVEASTAEVVLEVSQWADGHAPSSSSQVVTVDVPEQVAEAEPVQHQPGQEEPPTDAAAVGEAAVVPATSAPVTSPTGSVPATRREAHHTGGVDRVHDAERVTPPRQEVELTSKRLGEFEGTRESSDLLTADRLLDHRQVGGPEPEGRWQQFVYSISGRRINLGDSKRVRARKELDRRIAVPLQGGARFVPVLSRKGGVGKTTITTLLGMALADARDDRIIAIDANPDRGTLAERIGRPNGRTVRDLARTRGEVHGYNDVSTVVTRDETRLDVLASDSDPRVSEAFSDRDYHDVAALAAHYYSIVLTDTGTGIVHSVMGATLKVADQLVVVAGLSIDEARLASETLNWLETNGFAEQVRNAVVVLNNARPGTPLVRPHELEAHFRSRVRTVVRMPYDPQIGTGSVITFRDLQPATQQAARTVAAAVVEGLRGFASAA